MKKNMGCLAILLSMGALLGWTSVSQAEYRPVRDQGNFFSENARSEANRRILEIEQKFRKDFVIETFENLPEDALKGVDTKDKAAMEKVYHQVGSRNFKSLRVNGIYLMVIKQPGHLHIEVGDSTQAKAFTNEDRRSLSNLMLDKLKAKNNDQALLDGVQFVYRAMESHAGNNKRAVAPVAAPRNNDN
ncbi:MAG: TPM domain-containing protein, partial [Gemmataceae bacterium]